MSINLSLLPADEKNRIELDKQASFLVWKMREAKGGPEEIEQEAAKIGDQQALEHFRQSVEKYKRMMGVA